MQDDLTSVKAGLQSGFVVANGLSYPDTGNKSHVRGRGGVGANIAGAPRDNLPGERRLIFQKTLPSCAVQPRCQFAYGLSA